MTHKPNRVHKATGWRAIFNYTDTKNNLDWYKLIINEKFVAEIPGMIVEGEGWEEEKSEIDEVMNLIEKFWRMNLVGEENFKSIKGAIVSFAKNYKEQKS